MQELVFSDGGVVPREDDVIDEEVRELQLDLLQLKTGESKVISSTKKLNGGRETGYTSGHSDFSELFRQIKQKEIDIKTREVSQYLTVQTEQGIQC